jgi:hypothetical protein
MNLACSRLIAGLLILAIGGCDEGGINAVNDPNEKAKIFVGHADDESNLPEGVVLHKHRDPDAPARVERTPVVIDDPAEIKRTEQVFEQRVTEHYKQALAQIADGQWVFLEHVYALRLRREQAVKDLRAMLDDEQLAPKAQTKAAEKLISLDDSAGEKFLFNALQSRSAEMRIAALASLHEWEVNLDVSAPMWSSRVLALLDDPDERVVEAAARLSTYRSIPGAEAKLISLLEQQKLRNPAPIAEELAQVASSKRAVDVLLPHILQTDADTFAQSAGYRLRKLIEHPDPEVSDPVRKALYGYTLRFPKQKYDQILVEYLAKSAWREAIPVLEDIVKNAKDPVSRTYAVEALARLQPEKAIELLTEHIRREGPRDYILTRVRKYATENDFDQIAPVVDSWYRKPGVQIDTETVQFFLTEFGTAGEQFIRDRMNQLDDDARMWAAWKLDKLDLRTALNDLHAAGVIRSAPDELLKKMQVSRHAAAESKPVDTSNPHSLIGALATEGIVTMFDAESGTIPCDHDRLLLDFADGSKQQFLPQWPVQFWHRENEDDYDGPYTVQFVFRDRLFRIGAENHGDWYDVEAVVRVANFALATVGDARRFITLDSDGQMAVFVFANPVAFVPIAQKYRLPLSDDASKAMREGIEFEKRVIERSK